MPSVEAGDGLNLSSPDGDTDLPLGVSGALRPKLFIMPGMWFRGLSVLPKFRIDSNGVVMGEVDARSSRSDVVIDFLPLPWVRVLSTLRSRGVGPVERSVSLELLRGGVLSSTETELIAASSPWVRFWLVAEASGKLTRRRASANVFGSIGSLPSEPGP